MAKAHIYVSLKEGVDDPEGNNIAKTLHLLGFEDISKVRVSKMYVMEMENYDEKKLDEICVKLLANPVINDYKIEKSD